MAVSEVRAVAAVRDGVAALAGIGMNAAWAAVEAAAGNPWLPCVAPNRLPRNAVRAPGRQVGGEPAGPAGALACCERRRDAHRPSQWTGEGLRRPRQRIGEGSSC